MIALVLSAGLLFSAQQLDDELWHATPWEAVAESDGVKSYRKELPGFDLVAFRGERVVDLHIATLMGVYMNADLATDWVDMLVETKNLLRLSSTERIFYSRYDVTFPLSDRDYVMHSRMLFDTDNKILTVTYGSTTHPDRPAQDCCIRAQAYRTIWRFSALDGQKTKVEVEVLTDPGGWVPSWVVNLVQKKWPRNTINNLVRRAERGDIVPEPEFVDW